MINLHDFIFEFENLVSESKIIRCTLFAVWDQLASDMDDDNQAILEGLSNQIWKLDKDMQDFFSKGLDSINNTI